MSRIPLTAILAGGKGRRMGREKALLPFLGRPLIERVWSSVAEVSDRVVVVGGNPQLDRLGVETVADLYPGANALGGIATALRHAGDRLGPGGWALCVACDMPFLQPSLLTHLGSLISGFDVVVPRTAPGYEPLCAVYRVSCTPVFEEQIRGGNLRIWDLFGRVRTREVEEEELRRFDPELRSFLNLNRPADVEAAEAILRKQQALDSGEAVSL